MKEQSTANAKRVKISWTDHQRNLVYTFLQKTHTNIHSVPSLFRKKLQEAVLAVKVPDRPWGNNAVYLERKRYTEWLNSPVPVRASETSEFAVPVKKHRPGMEQRIAIAVATAQSETLRQIREMLAEHRQQVQEMIDTSHDSLMKYWNPEYSGLQRSITSAVNGISESVMAQCKVKAKRILVVSNNERRLVPLRDKFKDIEFTFAENYNPSGSNTAGIYDAIICTRFIDHSLYNSLRKRYPGIVHFANGSTSEVERMIRRDVVGLNS
jgi:hypothetical protein